MDIQPCAQCAHLKNKKICSVICYMYINIVVRFVTYIYFELREACLQYQKKNQLTAINI